MLSLRFHGQVGICTQPSGALAQHSTQYTTPEIAHNLQYKVKDVRM